MSSSSSSSRRTQGARPQRISAFDQFVKFITDASGLERTFRLLQATTQILTSYPKTRQLILTTLTFIIQSSLPILTLLLFPLSVANDKHKPSSDPTSTSAIIFLNSLLSIPTLLQLRSSFALGRRFFRVGRFLDSFGSAWRVYISTSTTTSTGTSSGVQTLQNYLTILASSFNGCYLLLETLHFPEVLLASTATGPATGGEDKQQLQLRLTSLWGNQIAKTLHVEGQRFWFFALICGAGAGLVKLINLWSLRAVPFFGSGQNLGVPSSSSSSSLLGSDTPGKEDEKEKESSEGDKTDLSLEQEKRKELKERQSKERQEFSKTSRKISRRIIADLLDLALPGVVVGWVELDSGIVGLCMLGSTVLTGLEVWDKCGTGGGD